jgi:signal transduction histidine kinase/CheY-like chemotaxis protein
MSIRNRILLLFTAILVLFLISLVLFQYSQKKQNALILKATIEQQLELVNTSLNVKSKQLDQIVQDYSVWDDLINRIQTADQNWANENIGTGLQSFSLHSICVYTTDFKLVYNFGKHPDHIFESNAQRESVLKEIITYGSVHYFYNSPAGIIEISSSTLHPTNDTAHLSKPYGIILISKLWDGVFLNELSKNTASSITVNHNSGSDVKSNTDSIVVSRTLLNEKLEKEVTLEFRKTNRIISRISKIGTFSLTFLSLFLVLTGLSVFIAIQRWVRKPLTIISESLKYGDDGHLDDLKNLKDEFGEIARLIKVFNHQKTELQTENKVRRLSETQLMRQSDLLQGMAEASNLLLTGENPDILVKNALEVLGKISGIDRVFVYKNEKDPDTGTRKVKLKYEWITPEIASQISTDEVEEFVYIHVDNIWYYPLFERKALKGITSNFPDSLRLMFERQHIKSLMALPIIDQEDDTFWGVVGFGDCHSEHIWSNSEENSLKMLANNIRNAIRRHETQENLRTAMIRAQAADKAKSEFLASMSHEIRTPMNGVFGMTSILLHTDLTPAQREYVEIIETSGDSLLNIINEILDFSKIESGHMELENTTFDLARCVEDVLDLAAPKALEKHLEIMYYIEPKVNQYIFGDGFRLRQILVNLVGNAIKFTSGGEIYIHIGVKELKADTAVLQFSVKDTGIGIATDKLQGIFDPFTQADATTTRKYGGTGLGLAISYKLVKLMQGHIWVESTEGEGSDFKFTIETKFTSPDEITENENLNSLVLAGKKVLIVDDNPTNRRILRLQCEFWGMQVTVASSGNEALDILKDGNPFQIAILDMQMPEMDGIMLATAIRKKYSENQFPMVMLTSIGFSQKSEESAGMFACYVNKPIKHSQLAEILVRVLSPEKTDGISLMQPELLLKTFASKYPLDILVAEDNIINQKMIKNVLMLLGYNAELAANGHEVLEALKRRQYSIIFMDIQMPEMDGYETTRVIVEHMRDNRPAIIAMTANAMKSDMARCYNAGMDDFISKPVKLEEIQKKLQFWGSKLQQKIV